MNCASSVWVTDSFKRSFFTWDNLALAVKCSKECTPNLFLIDVQFFCNFAIGQTFTYTTWRSVRINSYEFCLLHNGDRVFRDKCLYFEWSGMGCKICIPNHFYQIFIYVTHFIIGQTFTFTGLLFCLNELMWTVLPAWGWPSL